jgi:3-hydroxy acid dehydrogenase / malonic semialdehyde reductase
MFLCKCIINNQRFLAIGVKNMTTLKNKTVLITGATSGIGEACARYFAKEGARILMCARRGERLQDFAAKLQKSFSVEVHHFVLDIRHQEAVANAIKNLPKDWQVIDVLVNNAGLARGMDNFYEGEINDWDEMIDTNLKGLLYMTRQVLPGMVKRDSGHVINIGSVAGHDIYPKGDVYCATKHAVNAFTRALRLDLLGTKIRVTTVDPGLVETEFSIVRFKGDMEKAKNFYKGLTPLTADDVADAVLYCAAAPAHVNISELIIMPTDQAGIMTVNRK